MAAVTEGVVRTFLFADLREYSTFVQSHGDRAAAALLRAFRRHVRAAIATERGSEIHTEGDSFYVVFRTPGAAIRCALAVQRRAEKYAAEHPHQPIRTGIGINSGEAVEHGGGYVGSAVIVAKRLADQATAGQVLITETVRTLLRTGAVASLHDLGAWRLKGIAETVRVYEVERPRSRTESSSLGPVLGLPPVMLTAATQASPGRLVYPKLVQRDRQLAQLLEDLAAAAVGETRIVALTGEGGIGKSRLCRELAQVADRDGFYILAGRSFGTADRPYGPFAMALRPYARARGTEILRRLLGGLIGEIRRIAPELEYASSGVDEGALPDEERRERLMRAMQLLLEDATALRPVLLILEDFHHSDPGSRELLRYLASNLRVGLCVVLTAREDEIGPMHPLRAFLAELGREQRAVRMTLGPLNEDGVREMVRSLLPEGLPASIEAALIERSEGIPFYVEELVKAALDERGASAVEIRLPASLREAVRQRLARLEIERGPEMQRFLEAAAVAGAPLSYATLMRLSDRPETDAARDLSAAIEAQLLERAPTQREVYRFRHALTREAIEDGIAPVSRHQLARRVAEAFEATVDIGTEAAHLSRYFGAAGDGAKAASYARLGARSATAMGAYEAAIELLQDAVIHARGTADERDALEELALALQAAGRAPEAENALVRARAIAHGEPIAVARIDVRLAQVLRMEGRRDEAEVTVRRAIDTLEASPGELLGEAVCELADLAWAANEPDLAIRHSRRALQLSRRYGATSAGVRATTILGAALARKSEAEGVEKLKESIRAGIAHGLTAEVINGYIELERAERAMGRWDAARQAAEAGLALARTHGLEFAQARLLSLVANDFISQGRYREARTVAEQAVALARPGTVAATHAGSTLADVLTMQGEHAAALALFDQVAAEMERADPDTRAGSLGRRARALLGLGRLDDAARSVRAGIDLHLASTPGTGVTTFLIAAEVAEARRNLTELAELRAVFDQHFTALENPTVRVVRAEIEAIGDANEGRSEAAARGFDKVAAAYDKLGVPIRAMYRRSTATALRIKLGQDGRALRHELRALRDELKRRGAMRYVATIDSALARRRPVRRRAAHGPLDDRDLRVALLLARGATNARIADELKVSRPRAAALVVAALGKLGVESRAQVASWVVRRHLQPIDGARAS